MAVDLRKIKKLIELTKESGIAEIEIREGEESVRISTLCGHTHAAAPATIAAPAAVAAPAASPQPASKAESEQSYNDEDILKSPMVGTVYLSATPGADPFVEVGQTVKEGDVLCLVEAMKMFNQIESEKSGTITARVIDNASPVEFGQPLFIIE
jgi:acetyl-CoA carboxylase biotin carboxyl carrier protein